MNTMRGPGAPKNTDNLVAMCTDEQLEAIGAPLQSHCLVLAGAGCGKTLVLTRRIVHCVHAGIDGSQILALTFTRKAAAHMSDRLREVTEMSILQHFPVITTFHAFALSILLSEINGIVNFKRIGFTQKPRRCTALERMEILSRCATSTEREVLGVDLAQLDALVERLNVFPDLPHWMPDTHLSILRKIDYTFKKNRQHEGMWIFSDLLEGVLQLFTIDASIRELYQRRYRAVLVDEFQDTNPLQIKLLCQILGTMVPLFAVGDDDQAIYAFRGADRRPTISFAEYFPGARIFKLQTNFRNTPAILRKANRVFVDKDPCYRKILVSGLLPSSHGEKPTVHRFSNQEAVAKWIIEKCRSIAKKTGIPMCTMALLFRMNQCAEWMSEYFSWSGIPLEEKPQMLTIHKSKGLEFPVVFLCDMEEGVLPLYRLRKRRRITSFSACIGALFTLMKSRYGNDDVIDMDEERRLFYVAVTRAQQYLYLLVAQEKQLYGRTRTMRPSRFLKYMA